ncbi:ABC transporter ATP-binding protein [Propionibacteriaceae bacterium G57]|uniref:ABC transporter ATP-binding protein n=1 Tax=Aestuariimicrobium sp. G57 TaxID=3418485 RepID=UPI003DA708F9
MPDLQDPLSLTDVHVRFGDTQALAGLTLHAAAGQVTAVLGPNGAGKTTMVRCCTGLVTPDSGTISIVGAVPGSPTAQAEVGVMPQAAGAWNAIRARELLVHLGRLHANPHDADELLALLGIAHVAKTPYRRLSGGQQQSLNLAAALIGRPRLVFLDEPTAGLDPHVRQKVWQVIRDLRDAGVAVVLSTHLMDEAEALADQVWIMNAGRVTASGTVAELTREASLEQVFLATTTPGGK